MMHRRSSFIFPVLVLLMLSLSIVSSSQSIGMESDKSKALPAILNLLFSGEQILYTSHNLSGHDVAEECLGNDNNCPCSIDDVSIVSLQDYGEVTSNSREQNTYVNAIGHKKFIENLPNGAPVALGVYSYKSQVSLPVLPAPDDTQIENPDAVHIMIQLWDGRSAFFPDNTTTREAAIYWDLNPWNGNEYGKIKVYTKSANPEDKKPLLIDTGIKLTPDTNWHSFALVADLQKQKYVSITIDGEKKDLSFLDLAQVEHADWGSEVVLTITTESLASYPGEDCSKIFTWTTKFRDLQFNRLD